MSNKLLLALGAVFAFVFYFAFFIYKDVFISKMQQFKMIPKDEQFTELYFNDHLKLPLSYVAGADNSFKFTVHNLEHKSFTYEYEVEAIATDSSRIISEGEFNLNHDEYKTITNEIASSEANTRTKINVSLKNKNQSIHFWLNNEAN